MLELINRARSNPALEAQRLLAIAQTDPLIQAASSSWNLAQVSQLISSYGPLPPLAFNTRLIEAARDHDAVMLALNDQAHSPSDYLMNPLVATAYDGKAYYPVSQGSWSVGENIFAYSQNVNRPTVQAYVDYYHEGFMIDWGNSDFGHLKNLLAPGPAEAATMGQAPFSEIGIGLLTNAIPSVPPPANPSNPADKGLNVGPVLVTQEFAWHTGNAFLTGTVYQDNDNNQFYTPGEGLGNVVITAVGRNGQGTFQTQTWNAGGYSLQLPPGSYNVTASGNLPSPEATVVTIGADNVLWSIRFPGGLRADQPVAGAYDGNGKTEVAVFRPSTAQWFILGSQSGARTVQFGAPNLDIPVPGRYDGSGTTEIAVYRPTTSQWFILGPSGGRVIQFGAPNLDIPVPGDYDGDGKTDIAVFRPTTSQWFILGSRSSAQVIQFGAPGLDVPVPGNYDGTGRVEPAVYRPTTSQWMILGPSGGHAIQFGAPNLDIPVPGDYDGDGRTDIAVYRPTTAAWYIERSRDGLLAAQFGAANLDVPVPGDYDGISRSELAVFRPTTAQWFMLGVGGGRVVQFGQGGSSPPLSPNRGAVVSLGTETTRFGIGGATESSSTSSQAQKKRSGSLAHRRPLTRPTGPSGPLRLARVHATRARSSPLPGREA